MNKFNIRVARDIVTFETIELTDEQYEQYKHWHKDVTGEEFDEFEINPNTLNDYVLELDIPTTVNKTYSATEVDWSVSQPKVITGVITMEAPADGAMTHICLDNIINKLNLQNK